MDAAKQAFEAAKPYFGSAANALQNLKWEDVPEPVRQYIAAHPYLTAAQLALVLPTFFPGLFAVPVLGWLGFSSIGPVAGKANVKPLPPSQANDETRLGGGSIPVS